VNFKALSAFLILGLMVAGCSNQDKKEATTMVDTGPCPGSVEEFVAKAGDRVFFDFDRSDIRTDACETLARQADWLKKYPNVTVVVRGHCDERGTVAYNYGLGARRANAAMKTLIANGINACRIKIVSVGKCQPIAVGNNEEAWAQNRVAITVLDAPGCGPSVPAS
jgi:peptidoglycan-associated lipoprotein